jgi:hypothetical protein
MTRETDHQQLCSELLAKIEDAFPPMDMPPIGSVTVHDGGSWLEKSICPDCDYDQKQFADWDQKITSGQLDAFPVCDVFCLSAIGMKWALPHYLRQCIANGFYDDQMKDRLVFTYIPSENFSRKCWKAYRYSIVNKLTV